MKIKNLNLTDSFPITIDGKHIRWTHFITLTSPNGTSHRIHRRQVFMFLNRLAAITRTPLYTRLGGDAGRNVHSHILLGVSFDDCLNFMDRLSAFSPWKSWRHKTLDFSPYCPTIGGGWSGVNAQLYLVKDEHQYQRQGWVCPRRHKVCQKGLCPYCEKTLSLTAY